MKWTRNDREIWYLSGIFLMSLTLTLKPIPVLVPFPWWISTSVIFILYLSLPHLLAFVYGVYTQEDRGVPGHKENYLLALFISAPLSFLPPHGVYGPIIVVAVLFVSIIHAYSEYSKYRDFREVVLLFMVYAPWVPFVRMWAGYAPLR